MLDLGWLSILIFINYTVCNGGFFMKIFKEFSKKMEKTLEKEWGAMEESVKKELKGGERKLQKKFKKQYEYEEQQVKEQLDSLLKNIQQINLSKEEQEALSYIEKQWRESFKDHYNKYSYKTLKRDSDLIQEKKSDFKSIVEKMKKQVGSLNKDENTKVLTETPISDKVRNLLINIIVALATIVGLALAITQYHDYYTNESNSFLSQAPLALGVVGVANFAFKSVASYSLFGNAHRFFGYKTQAEKIEGKLDSVISDISKNSMGCAK